MARHLVRMNIAARRAVQTVLQTQRQEFVLAQLTGKPARHLIAKLVDPLRDQRAVEFVVLIHCRSVLLDILQPPVRCTLS
jgi:hypothetical protein